LKAQIFVPAIQVDQEDRLFGSRGAEQWYNHAIFLKNLSDAAAANVEVVVAIFTCKDKHPKYLVDIVKSEIVEFKKIPKFYRTDRGYTLQSTLTNSATDPDSEDSCGDWASVYFCIRIKSDYSITGQEFHVFDMGITSSGTIRHLVRTYNYDEGIIEEQFDILKNDIKNMSAIEQAMFTIATERTAAAIKKSYEIWN